MVQKTFFLHRIDNSIDNYPTQSYNINNLKELIQIIQKQYDKTIPGYPAFSINTNNDNIIIVFGGSQQTHPAFKPFKLYYKDKKEYSKWFNYKDCTIDMYNLLKNA